MKQIGSPKNVVWLILLLGVTAIVIWSSSVGKSEKQPQNGSLALQPPSFTSIAEAASPGIS